MLLGLTSGGYVPTMSDDADDAPLPSYFDAETYITASIVFRMPRPKSHYTASDPSRPLKKTAPQLPLGRVDIDNLVKFVLDSLNNLLFVDDRQVVRIDASKIYCGEAGGDGGVDVVLEAVEQSNVLENVSEMWKRASEGNPEGNPNVDEKECCDEDDEDDFDPNPTTGARLTEKCVPIKKTK